MTQLYLISPPRIELAEFRSQLQAALAVCHPRESGDPETSEKPDSRFRGNDTCELVDSPALSTSDQRVTSCESLETFTEDNQHFIGAFQLRLKDADEAQIRAAITELLPICRAHGVAFIINDRVDLCIDMQLDGVHVGQEDLEHYPSPSGRGKIPQRGTSAKESGEGLSNRSAQPRFPHPNPLPEGEGAIAAIRAQLSESMALGITCHASGHLAMEAAEAGADYVAFGAFYETTSKPKEKLEKWGTPTPDILNWWSTYTEVPCVAIGGITPENCTPLVKAGADFIAVINAVWSHPQGPAKAVSAFQAVIEQKNDSAT